MRGCGHRFNNHSTDDLCGFCVLSLHREVGSVRQYAQFKIAVHSAEGCCSAFTIAFIYELKKCVYLIMFDRIVCNRNGGSLKKLAHEISGIDLDKSATLRMGDWEADDLSLPMVCMYSTKQFCVKMFNF